MRKYVMMGVQGSGKGTQSELLCEAFDMVHISVGDMFRWHVQAHTKLGAQVKRTMAAGELVGDDLVQEIVRDRLRPARLEVRLRHRRLPAQRPAGRVLHGDLRHRRASSTWRSRTTRYAVACSAGGSARTAAWTTT